MENTYFCFLSLPVKAENLKMGIFHLQVLMNGHDLSADITMDNN